ncbi:MAG: DEAD/DEAH box helicase [Ignavibacteriales bacterium]
MATRTGTRAFGLFDKAEAAGVIESGKGLIIAPTGTGKSFIGRAVLVEALRRRQPGPHVYLIPYRALATEIYESLKEDLEKNGIQASVKVATGDYSDPIYPAETDILVATYERFSSLLTSLEFRPGRVVVDEVHLLADESRGPVLEGLLIRLTRLRKSESICALSAVVANPEEIAAWLNVPLVRGSAEDRPVEVQYECRTEGDADSWVSAEVQRILEKGEQVIVFCRSKAASQGLARDLREVVSRFLTPDDVGALRECALATAGDDEEAGEVSDLLSGGVAYHHAGLTRHARLAIENAFRQRNLKVITCTPTLAAGVNLPARLVVVRDVYRMEFIRGWPRRVVLSTGELLNMLGRAGRPMQVEAGRGVALVEPGLMETDEFARFEIAIREGKGDLVRSRMPDSFDALMRFLLLVMADRGEVTLPDLAGAVSATLWHHQEPSGISFDRKLEEDIMEDIPSFARVDAQMRLERAWPEPDGVAGSVVSGDKVYNFSLRLTGDECSCPAKAKFRPREVCKHVACAIYTLLFDRSVDVETRNRALYASAHRFRRTLDVGTKIQMALDLLLAWRLAEHVPGGYRATPVGVIAANSGLDLLLIRTARDRVSAIETAPSTVEVARWLVEDFFGDESKREKWLGAVGPWLGEVDEKKIRMPERYRGDFERGLENLGELASLYAEIARSLGKDEVAEACRVTRACLAYGVHPEIVPLAGLRMRQLGRTRCRILFRDKGIRNVDDLAAADPRRLAGQHIPVQMAAQWVEQACAMVESRDRVKTSGQPEREVDEFLMGFGVDSAILAGAPGGAAAATGGGGGR